MDVSHWNGHPDFGTLFTDGMRFVFSKVTQGTTIVDDTYHRHTREARSAGLVVGAYHFFDYRKGGKAQARHYLDTLGATTGIASLLPLVVDVETLGTLGTPDRAAAKWRLNALLDELYAQTGRYPMIYTSRHMWDQVTGGAAGFGRYPLWVACWKCDTVHLPRGWSGWDFWQFGQFKSSEGKKLDGNVWRSTAGVLQGLRHRTMRLDRGAKWTRTRTVEADLRGYDGVQVRYAADGARFGPWQPYRRRFELTLGGKQGKQVVRVQLRSFRGVKSPVLRDAIKLDSVPPSMWGPRVSLRKGVRVRGDGTRLPVVVDIGASDKTSGLASTRLSVACGGKVIRSKVTTSRHPTLTAQIARKGCVLKGNARDTVGLQKLRKLSPSISVIDLRRNHPLVSMGRAWKMLSAREGLGRTLASAKSRGATVKVGLQGSQFAIVARRGPAGGRFKVIVDGRVVDTIDLYHRTADKRRVVYVQDVPRGRHTVKLRATGSGRAASSGSIVWLDAVLVLDRRK